MTYDELINGLGGPYKVAELCTSPDPERAGRGVTVHAVYNWKRHGIPAARRQFLEQELKMRKIKELSEAAA